MEHTQMITCAFVQAICRRKPTDGGKSKHHEQTKKSFPWLGKNKPYTRCMVFRWQPSYCCGQAEKQTKCLNKLTASYLLTTFMCFKVHIQVSCLNEFIVLSNNLYQQIMASIWSKCYYKVRMQAYPFQEAIDF